MVRVVQLAVSRDLVVVAQLSSSADNPWLSPAAAAELDSPRWAGLPSPLGPVETLAAPEPERTAATANPTPQRAQGGSLRLALPEARAVLRVPQRARPAMLARTTVQTVVPGVTE
jgi:hypothetical protein